MNKNCISYVESFEDVMLWRTLSAINNGFYIYIGLDDPAVDSVSLRFQKEGWHGIHINPSETSPRAPEQTRIGDVDMNATVPKKESVFDFLPVKETDQNLDISPENPRAARKAVEAGYSVKKAYVHTITLDGVLGQISDQSVHWLKIDVKGLENRVVDGWKKPTIRPWIVVVESTLPDVEDKKHKQWEPSLIEKGYEFAYFDGLNRYYISNEHPELLHHFDHPPCIYTSKLAHVAEEARELKIALDSKTKRNAHLEQLLYSASFGQHLYRAFRVIIRDPDYRQHTAPKAKKTTEHYMLNAAWEIHIYRAIRGLFFKGEQPWHKHLYRSYRVMIGDKKYAPIKGVSTYFGFHSFVMSKTKRLAKKNNLTASERHLIEIIKQNAKYQIK